MTVQFILPEATSSPKERKLHDRLFLVLLYNLLCKTFKDHSSTFAASSRSERNSLLQERCFPIASAKVGHFSIPCKTSTKKNARKIHLRSFCYFIALQNRLQSSIFRFIPSLSFSPQNRPFSSISTGFGAKSTFFGVFLSSAREKFSPEISVCAEKISLTGSFCLQFVRISTFAGEEKEKVGVFSSNHRRNNIKTRKVLPKHKHKNGKVKEHHGKAKRQDPKASVLHRKDQAQPSKTNCFSSPPPLRSKNTSRLSLKTSPLFATSSLVSLKTSLPRTKSLSPYAQDTRLRVYTRPHSQRICHFCLHPSPHRATNCRSIDCV